MPFSERTEIVFGSDGMEILERSTVCVFGLGGVGATAAMDLVRAGCGSLYVFDFDTVSESNLNRLYFGYRSVIGLPKTEAFARYAREVNPQVTIRSVLGIVRGAHAHERIPDGCDLYLDCIDSLNPKVNLLAALARSGRAFASSMGTSGRVAPERLKLGSLWDSSGCPLAQRVRQRLGRLGIGPGKELEPTITCVWSDEVPAATRLPADGSLPGSVRDGVRVRAVLGSTPFVPQAAGHLLASWAVRSILSRD